tara:strand:- start:44 stop:1072 length:1029 start_codon:yes stop_codon:yes gene_type:complete
MQFLENTWYCAGWSADLKRELLPRRIIDVPVVLYRSEAGDPIALLDTCPHRFASLSLGQLIGDVMECPYHGLRFNSGGTCIHNPHGPIIPEGAHLRKFPVVEYDGLVWAWMGKYEEADESKITRFPELNRLDHFTYTRGLTMEMPLSYELITDNLMDLSHTAFIHADTLGNDTMVPGEIATRHEGDAIWSDRIGLSGSAPFAFWATGGCKQDDRVDYWTDIRWSAPANFYIYAGVTAPGTPRPEGSEISSVQILTPASATQTYYFIKHFRNFSREDDEMTGVLEQAILDAFANEDEPMIVSATGNMAGRTFWDMKPVVLPCDAAAIRVRREREKMLRAELAK